MMNGRAQDLDVSMRHRNIKKGLAKFEAYLWPEAGAKTFVGNTAN